MASPDELKTIFLFGTLSDSQIAEISSFCAKKHLSKGEVLFDEGAKASFFYHIQQGKIKIYRMSPAGQEHILEIHGPGDLVAEAAIFGKATYPAYCQALEDTILISIRRDQFVELVSKNPPFALQVLHGYSLRMRKLVDIIEQLTMYDIRVRLANYIWRNAIFEDGIHIFKLTVSKKELASVLATVPETLSRALKYLKDNNIISEADNTIIIRRNELITFLKTHSEHP